jgi:hypothetical protein
MMASPRWPGVFAWCVAACALVVPALLPLRAQDNPILDAANRLKGSWQLNAEQSSKWPDVPGSRGGDASQKKNDPPPKETDEQIQMRAALREVQPTPHMLFIRASPTEVSMTTDDGTIRTFVADGQQHPLMISAAKMQAKTTWSPAGLSQDLIAGPVKLNRTWGVSDDGKQLIINLRFTSAYSRTDSVPMKFVYDRMP